MTLQEFQSQHPLMQTVEMVDGGKLIYPDWGDRPEAYHLSDYVVTGCWSAGALYLTPRRERVYV